MVRAADRGTIKFKGRIELCRLVDFWKFIFQLIYFFFPMWSILLGWVGSESRLSCQSPGFWNPMTWLALPHIKLHSRGSGTECGRMSVSTPGPTA